MSYFATSDAPLPLVVSTLQAIPTLTGTEEDSFAFTIYTGDLVSHDPFNELSGCILYFDTANGRFTNILYSQIVYRIHRGPTVMCYVLCGNWV